MNTPRHVMILASAGSGKTYALTNRYVQLLAGGAEPERIVALTFTRKAAGEFFDEILHKLARAATDPAVARDLTAAIGASGLGPPDYLQLLRKVIEAMPRLNLGTLDAFFARIVRTFPLELGLGGEFTLLEESALRQERRRVLQRIFTAGSEPDAAQKEFIEAFKQATFGTTEKQLAGRLDDFIEEHAEVMLDAPQSDYWGNPRRIWPDGTEWLEANIERETAARELRATLPWERLSDGQRKRMEEFLTELPTWQPGAPLPASVDYLVKNSLEAWSELRTGRAEIRLDRKMVSLTPEAGRALATVIRTIVGAELGRRLEMTRGLCAVLQSYDAIYHDTVRRNGRLTFSDVQRLLLPAAGAPILTGADMAAGRLLIDWRLDAQFDHWLLDEFQDTSFAQWSILRNLLDEAVQDAEQRRSLFYVGDIKQAIFAWREGDPRLFREIFNHYNQAAPGAIAEEHLTSSFRSGPAVIAMVNRVFGDAPAVRAIVPADAAERWTREWRAHTTAKPELGGYAELRHAADEAGRFAETLRILQEVEPGRRGLTAAVLVQKNDTGARLADYLRREGHLPAVAESDLHFAKDNPLTCAVLALLHVAAHPGDGFAREHLAMTPLGTRLGAAGLGDDDTLTGRVLGELYADGFAVTIERWLRVLEPTLATGDNFSRLRGRQLVAAAREYDETGQRNVAEFLDWAEGCTVRETDTAGVVRVLTIHKAKGLGFDLVILPDLEGQTLAKRRAGLAVQKGPDRSVEWVLDLPNRIFQEHDKVLKAHVERKVADAAYEALCKFYVAMTRAKRAMYAITRPVGESSSLNFPKLLEQTLGETWTAGDPAWFDPLTPENKGTKTITTLARIDESGISRRPRLVSRRPTDYRSEESLSAALFAPTRLGAADHGIRVHALLETVEWWEPSQATAWTAARRKEGADADALIEVLNCLQGAGLTEVFSRPVGRVEVWREKTFEAVLDSVWLTGTFDRVVVERNADNRALKAWVIDFKTGHNTVTQAVARYAEQLNLYRRVVTDLTGLPVDLVRCTLVLTDPCIAVDVPQ